MYEVIFDIFGGFSTNGMRSCKDYNGWVLVLHYIMQITKGGAL